MTTKGDVIAGGVAGAPARLGVGTNGQVLTANSAAADGIDWETPFTSPMTTKGDLIAGAAGGIPARVGVGINGQVLTANSAAADGVDWETPSAGFANPMTTKGDLIAGAAGGIPARVGVGINGQVLTANSAAADGIDWETAATGTVTNSSGALTADLPVFGNGAADVKVGTKTGNTDKLVTQAGAATSGAPLLYDASGNAIAGSKTGNTSELVTATGAATSGYPLLYDASANAIGQQPRGNTTVVQLADSTTNPTSGDLTSFDANGNVMDSAILASAVALTANVVPKTRNVNTAAPLAGGGGLSADLNLTIATAGVGTLGASSPDGTTIAVTAGVYRVLTPAAPSGAAFSQDAPWFTTSSSNWQNLTLFCRIRGWTLSAFPASWTVKILFLAGSPVIGNMVILKTIAAGPTVGVAVISTTSVTIGGVSNPTLVTPSIVTTDAITLALDNAHEFYFLIFFANNAANVAVSLGATPATTGNTFDISGDQTGISSLPALGAGNGSVGIMGLFFP